jgi:hypothetical protein
MPVIPLASIGAMIARFDGLRHRKEFVQLPGLASHRHRGETAAMTDPTTPTEAGWLSPGVVGIGTASFLATPATKCFPTGDRRRVS